MNIGLFGGTFNPVHNGHIKLAESFLLQKKLDEVWLMVSPLNPLKQNDIIKANTLRLNLLRKAIAYNPKLIASDYEFNLPKPSYTWNTLQHLKHDFPNNKFTILIGEDNWDLFDRWYKSKEILSNYEIVIYPRTKTKASLTKLPKKVSVLNSAYIIDVSSTEIRNLVNKNLPINDLVPEIIIDDVKKIYSSNN